MGCQSSTQRLSKWFQGEYILSQVGQKPCTALQYTRRFRHISRRKYTQQKRVPPTQTKLQSKFAIERQLTYLGDPLKLSEYVSSLLIKDKFTEAEQLLRAASKNAKYTVGWNHLINYQLNRGAVNGACKTYNEMKKRAQTPDAHTYTILFRGLAANANYPLALTKALSIYHSMDAANSPVRPSTIHTNAVLQVCARAGDMDAMFGIAAKLKRKGLRSPNNLTFTIILNAIRQDASKSIINGEINEEALNKAIIMARRMWDDIVTRWRQGDIWIDEELVCSMGRILLLGKMADIDDIFSLIEQTMQVPRILPRLGTPERGKIEPSLQAKAQDLESSVADSGSAGDLSPSHEFRVVTPPKPPSRSLSAYAKPGPNTISLVLEALFKLRQRYPLRKYWDIFTKDYGAQPDSQNFHSYLRNLRLFRASKEAVEMLQQMPASFFAEKTFRIALSTCRRDKNNANSMSNAEEILDLMEENLPLPDLPSLQFYLDVAITSPVPPNHLPEKQHHESNYTPKGVQIKQALGRLSPYFTNIKSILADNERLLTIMDVVQANRYRKSAVELARDMVGAYDRLIKHVMADKKYHGELIAKRKDLASFVTEYNYTQIKPKTGEIPKRLPGDDFGGRKELAAQEIRSLPEPFLR